MKINLTLLRQLLVEAQFFGFEGDEEFDQLNIAHLKQFETQNAKSILYFAVYEDHPEKEGWYNNAFDRTKNIDSLKKDNRYSFVLDERVSIDKCSGLRCIYVQDIFAAIAAIHAYVLSQCKPLVIGITGSVGKTTTSALMEDVISTTYTCKRIYSKRITPLTLISWLVNYLDEDDEILVLEYSMYRPHHIRALTKILPPHWAIFLNIEKMHLGVEGINTVEDILASKEALTESASLSVLNQDDSLVMKAKRNDLRSFSTKSKKANAFILEQSLDSVKILSIDTTISFRPYIRTNLFLHQSLAVSTVAVLLHIPGTTIGDALSEFRPEENRILWLDYKDHKILFDGDVTISGRLKALAENSYKRTLLSIAHFDFGEENVSLQLELFNTVFSLFSEVRVLNNENNAKLVDLYGFNNIHFVDHIDQYNDFSKFDFIVVHYGIYFRMFKDLTELYRILN